MTLGSGFYRAGDFRGLGRVDISVSDGATSPR